MGGRLPSGTGRAKSNSMENGSADDFHSHIYFDERSRASATELQVALIRDLPATVRVSRLVDRPIGPHPLPMFELGFSSVDYAEVRDYLAANRGPHSVLLHPVTIDEVRDHTAGAVWLGPPVSLDIGFLRDFMAGTTPGVSQTVPFMR